MTEKPVNRDREALRRFVADPALPVLLDTSPFARALGAELLRYDAAKNEVTVGFSPDELFRQGAGVVQGGAVGAMLDYAMGFAGMAITSEHQSITTTTSTTNFFAPAAGVRFIAVGRLDKGGRRLMFTSGTLTCDGMTVATASSTLLVIGI